ncbi:MAG: protein-ADP-ribose hydrolase [Peptococcaceae bacterium]|nr:protein-ADP-ribose hydrolase [Peptococcaceae bacterium]
MTAKTELLYLIRTLLQQEPAYQGILIPGDDDRQRRLFRDLMNLWQPGPLPEEFWRLQDRLLQEELAQRGIVEAAALPVVPGRPRLALWQGDITRLAADAVVNAANSRLLGCFVPGHLCIDNVIHSAAGLQLRRECAELMAAQGFPEPTGGAKITKGYNLPAKYVLHTVGPVVENLPPGGKPSAGDCASLASCYRSCLGLAAERELETVAFCCISTGVFHFPRETAGAIALETVEDFLAGNSRIKKVIFNVFLDEDKRVYQKLLGLAQADPS